MRSGGPEVPPEIPPPWRPDEPPAEPGPSSTPRPPIPMVPTPREPPDDDAFARLLRRRIVLVTGELTPEVATRAAAELMTLDAEADEPVSVHLSCADSDLDAALLLADTIELMTVEVTTVCRGTLGGATLAPFVVAPRRVCSAHATFRMGEPRVSISGRSREIDTYAAALRAQLDRLVARIADATGQTADRVAGDMDEGRVLDADEALGYGLVHEVSRPTPPTCRAG